MLYLLIFIFFLQGPATVSNKPATLVSNQKEVSNKENTLLLNKAKNSTQNKNHEESLSFLKKFNPDKAQYNEYCFLMAVNYFSLNDKQNAGKWLSNLLDSFEPLEVRYKSVATLMIEDLKSWSDELGDVKRDMIISSDRLENSNGGPETQKIQQRIVDKLNKIIKEKEDAGKGGGDGDGDSDGKGNGKSKNKSPSQNPLEQSQIQEGGGPGKIDEKKLKGFAQNWGTMPPAVRAQALQDITRDVPQKYRQLVEDYNKSFNRTPIK